MTSTILLVISFLVLLTVVHSDDNHHIPMDKSEIGVWFENNVRPLPERKSMLNPDLVRAEASPRTMSVQADGRGEFRTISDALNNVPDGNTNRVIIKIGPGNYTEKVMVEYTKPFVTLYGDPDGIPTLVFDGRASQYGTMQSATLNVESNFFIGVNLRIVNSAPRGSGQAVAMTIRGDNAAFYNCRFYGYQDTVVDDFGKHFYKDCYVEGTVDFVCGRGRSLYLNTELHVISGDQVAYITAHSRDSLTEPESRDSGYSMVHSKITGTGRFAYLGRPWRPFARVVFAYSEMSDVVRPEGWSDLGTGTSSNDIYKNVFYGEYRNSGLGSSLNQRAEFTQKLDYNGTEMFLQLGFIDGSTWLLPPPMI